MTDVLVNSTDGIMQIRLNRPSRKNALSQQMYRELNSALQTAAQDASIKVVLLQGTEDCFSAGNDLTDFLAAGVLDHEHPTVQFLYQLAQCPKPLIAAVSGLAIGIGSTALLHCDLVYAAGNARFQLPFTQLGLCPEAASSLLLPRLVGYQRAAQYLLLGESFDAAKACDMGLVNQVVAVDELDALAWQKAQQLAALPADAVQSSKALLKAGSAEVNATIAAELVQFQRLLDSSESQQRIATFFKR